MIELTQEVKEQFIAHALMEKPREACGLVCVVKGRQRYHICRNIADTPDDFILNPVDYMMVEDLMEEQAGDILAVVHSHIITGATPSMADKVGCENSGLPWAIYSPKTEEWFMFTPSGYKAPLIGRTYKHGVFDCYAGAQDWYKDKYNIALPHFDRVPQWWNKGFNLLVDNFPAAGFYEVKEENLKEGDVILFAIGSTVVNHCAVFIGKGQVYHHPVNRLSGREIYGGWLQKNMRMVLRHKDL